MIDDLTRGIDLSGTPWPTVQLRTGINSSALDDAPFEIPGPNVPLEVGPLLCPATSTDPGSPAFDDWSELRTRLRLLREPIRDQLPSGTLVGVAYPRSMPPLLREYLPIILGFDPATSQGGLPPDSRLVGLEAPVALTLEAITSGAIPPHGLYAVATGQGQTREWTVVEIERRSPTNPTRRGSLLRIRLGRSAATFAALGLDAMTPRLVAGALKESSEHAEPIIYLPRSATATGAARFARWRELDFSKGRTPSDQRMQLNLLPGMPMVVNQTLYPLGLMGQNGQGAWFWRRLFDPDMSIPSTRAWLRSTTLPPCHLFFAECLTPDFRSTCWLTQDEWERAGLRWHSAFFHSIKNAPTPPIHWSIELRDFNDVRREATDPPEEAPPRWGLPTWITRTEARTRLKEESSTDEEDEHR